VALRAPAWDGLRRAFGRPFSNQICFADVRCIIHRLVRDRLEDLTAAVSNTNGGTDLQPHRTKVTGVWRNSKPAKMFPLTRKAHSKARHVFLFFVALGEHYVDFLLESGRLGDDRRKLIEWQTPPLSELACIKRQRGGRAEQ
jgi:hypothetical protein